jgi:hypothetical protein
MRGVCCVATWGMDSLRSIISHSRYAVYLTPPLQSDLWKFGRDVIGRDVATGDDLEGFAPDGDAPESWRKLTDEPRRYGFHATLVAPFRLRANLDVVDLTDCVAAFAAAIDPFEAGDLQVGKIATAGGRFVVLKPVGPAQELHAFADVTVRQLDSMRAPLTDAERRKREAARLTPRQRYYLDVRGTPTCFPSSVRISR